MWFVLFVSLFFQYWICKIINIIAYYGSFFSSLLYVCQCAKSLQLCPTLCNPMDYSLPGSSVHGIFQARILEWVAMPFSRDFPTQGLNPRLLYLLHQQAGSLPLSPLGKTYMETFNCPATFIAIYCSLLGISQLIHTVIDSTILNEDTVKTLCTLFNENKYYKVFFNINRMSLD